MAVILNWLWQGSAVALVATLLLAIITRSRARDRYLTVWAALISVMALPIVPAVLESAPVPAIVDAAPAADAPFIAIPVAWWTSNAFAAMVWGAWVAIAAGRVLRSAIALRRVRRAARCIAAARQDRLAHWSTVKMRGRRTQLMVCRGVRTAAVLGCGSPAIAIAPSLLGQLSDEELDRIVIHEWAHVQRRDDWTQLLVSCINVVAGWHPAVWWLDRQLRLEREVACDELAVTITGSAKGYAASLVKLAALPAGGAALPSLAAIGQAGLRHRVARILSCDRLPSPWTSRAAAAAGGVSLCLVAVALGGVRAIEAVTGIIETRVEASFIPDVQTPSTATRPAPSVGLTPASTQEISRFPEAGQPRTPAARLIPGGSAVLEPSLGVDGRPASRVEEIGGVRIAGAYNTRAPNISTSDNAGTNAASLGPWRTTADQSVALGRESRDAAVATANYFTRLGKRIAGSF